MADRFNPITDLQPVDPFNVPVEESSEEVESIRVKLIVTRNKTAELVDILKKKNISFNKDIDTIRELNRRLMRTIPRIPILRGEASTQTNRLEEISAQKSEFDIDTTVMPKPDPKIKQRLLSFAVDLVLFFYGGKLIKPLLKRLGILKLVKPKVLEELIPDNFKIPIEVPPIKTPIKLTPKQIKLQNIRRTLKEAETVIPLRKKTIDRSNFFNLNNNKERIIKNAQFSGPENLIQKLKQRSVRTIKNIYGTTDKNIKNIQEFIRQKKKNPELELDDFFPRVDAKSGSKTKGFSNNKVDSPDKNNTTNMYIKSLFERLSNKPKDISSLNKDTNTIRDIYIVDDDFTIT